MTRFYALLLLAVTLLGCFDPDEGMPQSTQNQVDACMPEGDLCSLSTDCCDWEGTARSGAGVCVNFDDAAECTTVCYADGDCAEGCCGALVDNDAYGACGPCNAAPFVRGGSMLACGDPGTHSTPVDDGQCQCLPGYVWCSDAPDDYTCCEG